MVLTENLNVAIQCTHFIRLLSDFACNEIRYYKLALLLGGFIIYGRNSPWF